MGDRVLVFPTGRSSRERKRRRHLRASVFALALPLCLGPGWAIWAAVPKASAPVRGPQRRLLGNLLQVSRKMGWYRSLPSLCIYLVPRERVRALVIGKMDLLKAEDIILGLLPLEA